MRASDAAEPSRYLLRVLIVEDSAQDTELEAAILRRAGYPVSVDIVDCPEAMRQRMAQMRYDLILCDHNLRNWLGMDALEIARNHARDIPFIVVTATLGDEAAVDYIKHGASDYVLKNRLERLPVAAGRALRERARQEQAVRLQEEILAAKREWELTFDTVPDPVFLLDREYRVQKINRAATEAFDRPFSEIIGRCWCEILDPGGNHESGCSIVTRLDCDAGKAFDVQVQNNRFYEVRASRVRDVNGGDRGCVCVMRDVTARKQGEAALRESEERFRELFEEAPVALHEVDRDGIVRRVNRVGCELGGYTRDEIVGKPAWDFMVPESRERLRQAIRQAMSNATDLRVVQRPLLRKDGTSLTAEIHARQIVNARGQVLGIRSCMLDVSERRKAHEALSRNEQFLSSVFESIQDGLTVLDEDMNIVRVNPTVARIFGPADELAGKKCYEVFHHRSSPCDGCPARRPPGGANYAITARHDAHGNQSGWVEIYAFPLIDPLTGKPSGTIEYVRDVSEQKRLEEQLRQSQKIEAVGRLAGGIAHDFNNLLMVIMGYSDLLLEQTPPNDERGKPVREIRRAADRAASLTRQLLAFSRKQVLQPQVLDLNAVVQSIDSMLRRLIGEDIELLARLAGDLAAVRADPGQVEQVIMNLALNARDAMPRGGKLVIETANVTVDDDYAACHPGMHPGEFVMLAVSDIGHGMDSETLAHIFEPFFTTKERGRGTGLGLATVYGIVKQSQGFIWVYSEPGKGTTFKIYFARLCEADSSAPKTISAGARQVVGGSETVLVVEDEQVVRELVSGALAEKGYCVLTANDGESALRLVEDDHREIHLLVSDVVMPRMSGRELAARVKRLRPRIQTLFTSGYTDDAIVHHGVLEESVPFLQKPFTTEALCLKVREILDHTRIETALP